MLASAVLTVPETVDVHEWMDTREWGDGLPIVPPTIERVRRMLIGKKCDCVSPCCEGTSAQAPACRSALRYQRYLAPTGRDHRTCPSLWRRTDRGEGCSRGRNGRLLAEPVWSGPGCMRGYAGFKVQPSWCELHNDGALRSLGIADPSVDSLCVCIRAPRLSSW
jgi:hypothetical protein